VNELRLGEVMKLVIIQRVLVSDLNLIVFSFYNYEMVLCCKQLSKLNFEVEHSIRRL